ncbi:DNA polymerase I [Candidatus Synechococcus spongiarum]|uniref:DNA polymerase I n=1 Tax=Candidatus Synechococcus spongiarum TaxID=431041 RepID=A0A164Z4V3_9SYNE|nr:DNA polymerase I [Candidatus Synechococcus spongiarum]SAY38854.1 DNA polymerase I (EC 2.7.7.7) [Candidatus Synechococcus spongiarum]
MADAQLLLLVDGHSLAFRSYYALAKGNGGLSTSSGIPTSVTHGFLKALLEAAQALQPQGVVIAFDTGQPTFRHHLDATYKANRGDAPEEFHQDVHNLQHLLQEALRLPVCTAPGFEADDVIAAVARQAVEQDWRVRILSGDRDLFQLVDDRKDVACLYMGGGPYGGRGISLVDETAVRQRLGVAPHQVVDLKALTGDSSDNIPGVWGIGPKSAVTLLAEYGDLDAIYSGLVTVKPSLAKKLEADRDSAFRSRTLARIRVDVPLAEPPPLALVGLDAAALATQLRQLELQSLSRQLGAFRRCFGGDTTAVPHGPHHSGADHQAGHETSGPRLAPRLITTEAALASLLECLEASKNPAEPVALDTETTSLNPFQAQLVGIGICWGENNNDMAYIPLGHQDASPQLDLDLVLSRMAPWLASEKHPKCLQNAKYDRLVLLHHGLRLNGVVMDTLLADYLLDPAGRHGLSDLAQRHFGFLPTSFQDLVGNQKTIAAVAVEAAAQYCAMDVHLTRRLATILRQALATAGPQLEQLFAMVEMPLEPVLARMEATGMSIDCGYLQTLSQQLARQLEALEQQAHGAAGRPFNLASPKQLGQLLFETLQLDRRKSRKTKTGYSTDAVVLERLAGDHPVVNIILQHRTLSKLKGTYVDALPALVDPTTGRVHTDFNQAVTATGRLSSSNPNLQNIPIRTAFSRQVRQAFFPQPGWQLISADYSQIELRILAHLCEEPLLLEAYNRGDDVHALTAQVLLDKKEVSAEERRLGKTINFGVIYGMGPQRFARTTGVSRAKAQEFLDRYRSRYPRVFAFLELQERLALSQGYVETLLGRRRLFHFAPQGLGRYRGDDPMAIDLDQARRGGLEAQQLRAAANAPIQGSSADIIKLAMVRLHDVLAPLPARLLLQVHDELVLEAAPEACAQVMDLVRHTMETVLPLRVPLRVEARSGSNWMEAK